MAAPICACLGYVFPIIIPEDAVRGGQTPSPNSVNITILRAVHLWLRGSSEILWINLLSMTQGIHELIRNVSQIYAQVTKNYGENDCNWEGAVDLKTRWVTRGDIPALSKIHTR